MPRYTWAAWPVLISPLVLLVETLTAHSSNCHFHSFPFTRSTMFSFISRRNAAWQLLALTVVVSLASGCCLRPYDNMHVPTQFVPFLGFGMKPNERVFIQAKGGIDPLFDDRWATVGVLWTAPTPTAIGAHGLEYYGFGSHGIYIPEYCWDRVGDRSVTAIRCVDASGRVLYSADETVAEVGMEGIDLDPVEGWLEYGNRKEYITVWRE